MSRKWGDRKDATRVELPGLIQCCIDLKPGRLENEVYMNFDMDVTALSEYIEEKNRNGEHITYFQAFVVAIAKVIFSRPKLNRFVANRHMYEHNEVSLSFVAKMSLNDKSEELMLVIPVTEEDNINTLADKVKAKIENLRGSSVKKGGANSGVDFLCKLPNIIRVPVFGMIKWLDSKGILPDVLVRDNIYFSSMIISNLGSIKCGAIYHNLANFGTCSSLITMGEIRTERVFTSDDVEVKKRLCEFGITLDERIADGYYFAKSAKMIEYVLLHPELLEEPVGNKIEAEELR